LGACQLDFKYSLAQHTPFLQNLCLNGLAFGNFSLGNHQAALDQYKKIDKSDQSTDLTAVLYNTSICEGIILHDRGRKDEAISIFYKAYAFVPRP
jgi:tetratricopeptide (TPR) repeat protein